MEQNSKSPQPLPEPSTDVVNDIRSRVSPERWSEIVADGVKKASVLDAVAEKRRQTGLSLRASLKAITREVPWPTFERWCRLKTKGSGPVWERLVDHRVPPPPERIPEEVGKAAVILRRVDPAMDCDTARIHLAAEFGDKQGRISDTSLRNRWRAAGLTGQALPRRVKSRRYDGGAGLAFLVAASVETNAPRELADAVLEAGDAAARAQGDTVTVAEPAGRDDRGRLTAAYNRSAREGLKAGEPDFRRGTDAQKRAARDLDALVTLQTRPETLALKLMAMAVYPLLSEQRGHDGLQGPRGALLGVLGGTAYMPTTCDKFLAELGKLNVGDALWAAYARTWYQVSLRWSAEGPRWLQLVQYVDATQEPYWTRRFACSSKVSQVGRVMPCLSRVCVMVGPGVPLLVDTFVGTVSLKKQLIPTLDRVEKVVGRGEVARITVIDAEMATAAVLSELKSKPGMVFVTVWKGKADAFNADGEWQPFRQHDRLREGKVTLHGVGAPEGGLKLRAVEMQREGSRHPKSTIFLTNAAASEEEQERDQGQEQNREPLMTEAVATVYLSRWPHQEQRFRDARNGLGLERSHGYGGEYVQNVALETALEKSARSLERAAAANEAAASHLKQLKSLEKQTTDKDAKAVLRAAIKAAATSSKTAEKALATAQRAHDKNSTMPRVIYKRDTIRECISTVLTMMALMLIEFVLQEYFDGSRIDFRTYIEHFVNLPVTVIDSRGRTIYRIEVNSRDPVRAEQVRNACAEMTRRKLCRGKKFLVFEAVDVGGP